MMNKHKPTPGMEGYRLIIAGSRTIFDEYFVHTKLDALTKAWTIESIMCGMAEGPDLLGKLWGEKRGIPVIEFPADWDGKGKAAGYLRNKEMADYAIEEWKYDGWLIAFLDVTNDPNGSKGTNHMIQIAQAMGLRVDIVRCKCKPISEIKR